MSNWQHQEFINQLEDKADDRRRDAATQLSAVGDGETLVPLLSMASKEGEGLWRGTHKGELRNPDAPESPFVYAHFAVRSILEREGCWEDLRKALVFRDPAVRAEAAWSLGHSPFPNDEAEANIKALVNALQDPEPAVGLQVLRSLGNLDLLNEGMLASLLGVSDPLYRWTVITSFGKCEIGPRSLVFLVGVLADTDESPALRAAVAAILGNNGDPRLSGPLIEALSDDSDTVRQAACLALGEMESKQAATPLFQTLCDPEEMVRFAAGIALARLGDARTIPFLLRAKRDGDMGIQAAAKTAMDKLGTDALPDLIQAMKQQPLPYKMDAADSISELKDPRATLSLIEALLDEDISLNARQGLLNIGEATIDPLIFVAGNKNSHPVFQEKCIRLLVDLNAEKAFPTLISLLQEADVNIRILSARALGDMGAAKAKAPMLKILKKGDKESDELIAECLLSLSKLKEKKALPYVLKGLDHLSSKVRGYSIASLGELGDSKGVEPLIDKLSDASQDNRSMMIQALAKLGDDKAVKPLLAILEEAKMQSEAGLKGGYLGAYAIQALAKLGEGSVVRILLRDWEEELESAMESLGPKALPYLEQALEHDRSDHVRALAAEAMGVVGKVSSMGALITALQDDSDQVRDAAAWALNQINSVSALPAIATTAP